MTDGTLSKLVHKHNTVSNRLVIQADQTIHSIN